MLLQRHQLPRLQQLVRDEVPAVEVSKAMKVVS